MQKIDLDRPDLTVLRQATQDGVGCSAVHATLDEVRALFNQISGLDLGWDDLEVALAETQAEIVGNGAAVAYLVIKVTREGV